MLTDDEKLVVYSNVARKRHKDAAAIRCKQPCRQDLKLMFFDEISKVLFTTS